MIHCSIGGRKFTDIVLNLVFEESFLWEKKSNRKRIEKQKKR